MPGMMIRRKPTGGTKGEMICREIHFETLDVAPEDTGRADDPEGRGHRADPLSRHVDAEEA